MSKRFFERLPMNLAIHSPIQTIVLRKLLSEKVAEKVAEKVRVHRTFGKVRLPLLWVLLWVLTSLSMLAFLTDPVLLKAAEKSGCLSHSSVRAAHRLKESQPVPGYRYHLVSLSFLQPRRMSTGAGNTSYTSAIEIQLELLDDDREHSTPAVPALITLNGYSTSRTTVENNGLRVTAWLFGVTLEQLEAAARAQGGWSLEYQPRLNSSPLYRISPNGRLNALENRPVILTDER